MLIQEIKTYHNTVRARYPELRDTSCPGLYTDRRSTPSGSTLLSHKSYIPLG